VTRTIFPTVVSLARGSLPELATLDARLLQELAVLLLRHPLATLLDDRTHENPLPADMSGAPADRDDPDSLAVGTERAETAMAAAVTGSREADRPAQPAL
jgi:hypothetical protein